MHISSIDFQRSFVVDYDANTTGHLLKEMQMFEIDDFLQKQKDNLHIEGVTSLRGPSL